MTTTKYETVSALPGRPPQRDVAAFVAECRRHPDVWYVAPPGGRPASLFNDLKRRHPDLEVHVRQGRVYVRATLEK
jgi:hypothetical protein